VKFTDIQLRLLTVASHRDDRTLERPSNLTAGPAGKVVAKLLTEGRSWGFALARRSHHDDRAHQAGPLCGLYPVSTEYGLDQEFNFLDAQRRCSRRLRRETCHARRSRPAGSAQSSSRGCRLRQRRSATRSHARHAGVVLFDPEMNERLLKAAAQCDNRAAENV
jgi:hypothetical protein